METRKITIVSTKNQSKKTIMSSATTLAELKADLRREGIDYTDMTFFEGTSKVELKTDNSVLPHDVPWKGTTTNELVFMLTNTNKKIRSGAMTRLEAYDAIKKMGLQEVCLKTLGKNFTMCKTADLIALIERSKDKSNEETSVAQAAAPTIPMQHNKCVDTTARAAIVKLTEILEKLGRINEYEAEDILNILNKDNVASIEEGKPQLESSYSDDEIDVMFNDMSI